MGVALQVNVELYTVNCGCCGGVYAINEGYRVKQYEKGGVWTCPYCKVSWGYSNSSENALLKKQLEEERLRRDRALSDANQLRADLTAQKAQTTKARNQLKRVKHGVCPCCSRSFQNLRRHIETKHPTFQASPVSAQAEQK